VIDDQSIENQAKHCHFAHMGTDIEDAVLYTALLAIFSFYFGYVYYVYKDLINGSIKVFLWLYLVIMAARPLQSALILILQSRSYGFDESREDIMMHEVSFQVDQITVQLSELLFYFVLFKMKKIEI